jgi:polyferredoxin
LAAYVALWLRSRRAMLLLSIASITYFGFYRQGCVCPVGSIQNVAMAAFGDYALPWVVGVFFLMPLLFTLRYGRVFCAGVCPLGAIQDLVVWRTVQVPVWLESALGLIAWAYLGLAVLLAATGCDFVICRYDPFVGLFRFSATPQMLMLGATLLIGGMFVGRIYCRVFCPYGVLLRWLSPLAKRRVSISPSHCVDCRLCEQSCPFGAIRQPIRATVTAPSPQDRRRLAIALLLIPAFVVVAAVLGYRAGPSLSRTHRDVRLAEMVQREQTRPKLTTPDEIIAFRSSGRSADELFAQVQGIQRQLRIGGAVFGGFLGLAVGLRFAGHTVRRRSSEYLADSAACLACARCFKFCPVEQERLTGRLVTLGINNATG